MLNTGVLVATMVHSLPAAAQNAPPAGTRLPSSGSLLQSNPVLNAPTEPQGGDEVKVERARAAPTPEASADQAAVHVARIEVDNVPAQLQPQVDAVVARYRDRDMTLTDVRNVAVLVTGVLLDNGETISYAYVPQQKIVDGVVRLRILRGHVEAIRLRRNDSPVKDGVLQGYLDSGISPAGDVQTAQEQLTRMSDLPGMGAVKPMLSPGQTPGGTILTVDADAGTRVSGVFVADNAGTRVSGRNRLGAQVGVNSPLGLGDRFQAVFYGAPSFLQFNHDSDGGNTLIGRVSYDMPVGTRGARAGVSVSRVNYTLGGLYNDLGEGNATVYSLYGSYPLVRTPSGNLDFNANLDYKRLSDSLFDDANQRWASVVSAQVSGSRQGGLAGLPNIFQYQVGVTGGDLHNQDAWNGAQTRGTYFKATQYAKLSQVLHRGVYLDLSVQGQQASRNLDGSEKMSLGGPSAVRAYSNDTVSADSGHIASAQLNAAVPFINGLTAQVFYDRARATVQKFVSRGANALTMEGYGFGLNYVLAKRAEFNLTHARRMGSHSLLGQQHRAMTWFNAAVRF
ncbi:ShlB/FhaC/HecB family hemolysin secretion/activation protein [Ralstonia sp. 24A2]|uniref:ShlB/FhaC/HecB family hemolysin secretion/activation protein n=1 Tax=Ralstonia sp. 24A2 TaxID=3447364 RepID=UPI003F6978C0